MSEAANPCGTTETLAAFVEGRLEPDARNELVRHLDRCAACREIVAEAVEVRNELGAEPLRAPTPRIARYAVAAAAAALLLAALLGLPTLLRDDDGAIRYLERATTLRLEPGTIPSARPGGGAYGFGADLAPERGAFRIGVRLVNLELAGASEDAETAGRSGSRIAELLALFPGSEELAARFRDPSHAAGAPSAELVELLEARGQGVPLALGAWTQLARSALRAGDLAFFVASDAGRIREQVTGPSYPAGVRRTLGEIETIAEDGPPDARDLERLERLLDDLIDMM